MSIIYFTKTKNDWRRLPKCKNITGSEKFPRQVIYYCQLGQSARVLAARLIMTLYYKRSGDFRDLLLSAQCISSIGGLDRL